MTEPASRKGYSFNAMMCTVTGACTEKLIEGDLIEVNIVSEEEEIPAAT